MVQIANASSITQLFATPTGTVEVLPGTADDVDVDPKSDAVAAKVNAGLIVVGGSQAQAERRARRAVPPQTPVDPAGGEGNEKEASS